jgi:ABC-type Zn uptake system ZnuABC Zn-binding protein ZnuA
VQSALAGARSESSALAEQLAALSEDAEEAKIRAIVSENTADIRDARHAEGHVERLQRELQRLNKRVDALVAEEHALLNKPLFDE